MTHQKHMLRNDEGFSLLELVVVVAIIGLVVSVIVPGLDGWTNKRSFNNAHNDLRNKLSLLRNEAMSRNTTSRILIQPAGNDFTISTYYADAPTTNCSTTGTWTQLYSITFDLSQTFEVVGSGVGAHVCFFRDGSSTGGTYTIRERNGGMDIGTATLTLTVATGFSDVSVTKYN